MTKVEKLAWSLGSCLIFAGVILAWQKVADAQLLPKAFFPGPDRTWAALQKGVSNGSLWADTLLTLRRMAIGWALASLTGIALGVVIGLSERARIFILPMFEAIRPLPASAIAPLAILLFGLSDTMILVLVAFGALWPALLTTAHGISVVHIRKREVARSLGMTRLSFAWKIALPSSMPDILSGLRLALTVALILTVVGEMITVQGGLGALIINGARRFNSPNIFAGIVLLGLIGLLTNAGLSIIQNHLLRWQRR